MDIPRLGKQPPRYTFFLNPYTDVRFTKCPICGSKARQKKLPLVVHVDEGGMIAVNKTCRYCAGCDLLIAHQDEIKANLGALFEMRAAEVVGDDYLVIGTLDRPDWKRGITGTTTVEEAIEALHDFKNVVRFEPPPGWIRTGHNGEHPE
jgi:predicted signal transduction protein with EAL and GGDEF domain